MNRISSICSFVVLLALCSCANPEKTEQPPSKPNIILIMSDDMGYSDIQPYGGEINTPNLNNLAKNGVRFSQFYNVARCCPTRASLLTGLYPHQAGMGWMTGVDLNTELEPYQGDLSKKAVTLAEVAKSAGYSTMMTGKWHVSANVKAEGSKHNWPLQRGFDRYYGTIQGAGNYYDPATLCRDNTLITPFIDEQYRAEDYYYTNAISDEAVRFVEERDKEKPFFMYMAYTAAHWPMQAPNEEIAKYEGVYDAGWEAIRMKRLERLKSIGLVSPDLELSPLDVQAWSEEPNQEVMARRMEIYAAMIDVMDQGIGRLLASLEEQNILDNTVILFLQDNGGCAEEIGTKGQTRPWAGTNPNSNSTQPRSDSEIEYNVIPRTTRAGRKIYQGDKVAGGPDTTYVAYGKEWANVSNTPFREYKHWLHEGGISTPLIVHYPDMISNPGRIIHEPGHIVDIMPTLAELMGATYPTEFDGNSIPSIEGQSLLPVLREHKFERQKALCWEHEANRAVRKGKWKLVSKGQLYGEKYGKWTGFDFGEWELYNMETDRSELHNLVKEEWAVAAELEEIWDDYAARIGVFPEPWTPEMQDM